MNLDQLFSVAGRVACVTGASSGLGQHAADVLARAGAKVVGVARRADRLEGWAESVAGEAAYVAGDLADARAFKGLADAIARPFGPPDILVNAAGLNPRKSPADLSDGEWEQTLAINLTVPYKLARRFAPDMVQKSWGRIINFASLQSYRAFPDSMAYGASKGGVAQLTRAMAQEWSGGGINANAIGPGFFETELTAAVFADKARAERNAAQTCMGRNGVMQDMDGPLMFLASDASRYVTGQILMVDGGFTAR